MRQAVYHVAIERKIFLRPANSSLVLATGSLLALYPAASLRGLLF
jgi:hypothetical protein